MKIEDLEIFNEMPFFFWIKDGEGEYLWANRALIEYAGENIVGKKDVDCPWSDNAEKFREVDKQVLESGKPKFLYEHVDKFIHGKADLCVSKFVGDFNGKKCAFGVSFIIEP